MSILHFFMTEGLVGDMKRWIDGYSININVILFNLSDEKVACWVSKWDSDYFF